MVRVAVYCIYSGACNHIETASASLNIYQHVVTGIAELQYTTGALRTHVCECPAITLNGC